jgi:hypothetical protein
MTAGGMGHVAVCLQEHQHFAFACEQGMVAHSFGYLYEPTHTEEPGSIINSVIEFLSTPGKTIADYPGYKESSSGGVSTPQRTSGG